MGTCSCGQGLGNTGLDNCVQSLSSRPVGWFMAEKFDSSGNEQSFDLTSDVTLAIVNALVQNIDTSDRFYPVVGFKNVEFIKTDRITEDFDDGTVEHIRSGVYTFNGKIPRGSNRLVDDFNRTRCNVPVIFLIMEDGTIMGRTKNDVFDTVFGLDVDPGSFNADGMFATGSESGGLLATFNLTIEMDEGQFWAFTPSDFNPLQQYKLGGLRQCVVAASGVTVTAAVLKITTQFGNAATGLVTADFIAINVTDAVTLVITSVTEQVGTPGTYDVVIPTQDTADVVTYDPSQTALGKLYVWDTVETTIP